MANLHKAVTLEVRYRHPNSDKWHTKLVRAEKSPSGIARIYTELWAELDKSDNLPKPSNPDIDVIEPNWAGTGEPLVLSQYRPFRSIYTNWDQVTL